MITLKNILVATDFGEAADAALSYGRTLAGRFGATLHVLHVAPNIHLQAFGLETYAAAAPELQRELEEDARKRLDAFDKTLGLVDVNAAFFIRQRFHWHFSA